MMKFRGELYPCETDLRLCEELATGQEVEVDMDNDVLTVLDSGKQYNLKPLGEVRRCHTSGGWCSFAVDALWPLTSLFSCVPCLVTCCE